MTETSLVLSQSKYFTPAFNTAIFDGAVRIYFSQHQEQEALQIYFALQSQKNSALEAEKTPLGGNIFVMLYPNQDSFERSFDLKESLVVEKVGEDVIIGLEAIRAEQLKESIFQQVSAVFDTLDFV